MLVQLEQHELTNREMKNVKGGTWNSCGCGCCDHLPGYSGDYDNGHANCSTRDGLTSRCGGPNSTTFGC